MLTNKILGLDLGTNSIGWAIVENNGKEFSLLNKGARIFQEGVKSEKGIESSRAAERTNFRSARKIKYRRKLRKYETLKVLSNNGMCPLSLVEIEQWKKSGFKKYPLNPDFLNWLRTNDEENINPYHFRDKASKQKIPLFELGRAFYHIAQRRGFLSNRLDQSADGITAKYNPEIQSLIEDLNSTSEILNELQEYYINLGLVEIKGSKVIFNKDLDEGEKKLRTLFNSLVSIITKNEKDLEKCKEDLILRLNKKEDLGKVKGNIKDLSQAMSDGGFKTLGQYFNSLHNKGKIRNQYTAREEHYLAEFIAICKTQGIESINEKEVINEKKFSGLAKDLYRAIFFQRPLKSQKNLIGKCSFEKTKSRCSISHPDFEEYRMWTYLNTIKIGSNTDKTLRFLTAEEKKKIIPKFYRKRESFNFEDLAKELIDKKATFGFYKSRKKEEFDFLFNYKPTDSVSTCFVSASLKNIFGDEWKEKSFTYDTINNKGENVTREIDYKDLWHIISVSTSDIYLVEFAKRNLKLDDRNAKAFGKIKLKKDFASLSLNAINKILPYLKEGLLYSHAVFMANIENVVDKEIWSDLEQRFQIQKEIGNIIENHQVENKKLEIINGLIKDCKTNKYYFSEEALEEYQKDLEIKLKPFFRFQKIEDEAEKAILFDELFYVFIEQLKKYEYLKIQRLDEKVKAYLVGENSEGVVFCSDSNRFKKMYHPSDIDVFKKVIVKDENENEKIVLGSPLTPSIKNPMAMRALHQLRKVLNTLILEDQIDEHTRIHIEMARELNDANRRKGIQKFQKENQEFRENAIKEIKKLYFEECKKEVEPNEDDILRYQLWIEQNKQEIYEPSLNNGVSKNIQISQIIGSNPDYDIEHTIPRSISQDNSLMNKTLCSKYFNREIKKNKMPIELSNHALIIPFIEHWGKLAEEYTQEIKSLTKQIKAATSKEIKDLKITKRHLLSLKLDYVKGKYDRFFLEEPKVGFKNSQIPDTGIITKYAQAYLKSYFKRVESVKGGMVAEFRKQWGIQESFIDENGIKQYKPKDRSKHTHHTIDAITIACMTKDKYDVLAHAWTLEDHQDKQGAREIIKKSKPWKTFKEDLLKIENEILVSHFTPDNVKKQSKKILRIRGKKQYVAEIDRDENNKAIPRKDHHGKVIFKLDEKGNKIPRLQQGDTIRGSLHQDSIYGAIKDPQKTEEIRYVIRKDLESLKASDIENIVDEVVKEKVKEAVKSKVLLISSNAQQKNKLDGKVWMNEEKQIQIKKVKIYANSVKNPLEIKEHVSLSKSKYPHKQKVYGQNYENYAMAIYEGMDKKGEIKRSNLLLNYLEVGKHLKMRINKNKIIPIVPIVPELDEKFYPLKYILTKGKMVLIYDQSPDELFDFSEIELMERLFKITQLDGEKSAEIKLMFHQEARDKKEITNFMGLKKGMKGGKNIGKYKKYPWIKVGVNSFDCLVEGYDFELNSIGKIIFKTR